MDDDSIEMEEGTDSQEGANTDGQEGANTGSEGQETTDGEERQVVTEGPFEREADLSRDDLATFLRDLAEQVEAGGDLTVGHGDWEVPFSFREPVELEVELEEEEDERELEIELEFEE